MGHTRRHLSQALAIVLALVTLFSLAAPSFAATYSHTIIDGDHYTVKVGDVLELYNPDSNSGMSFSDYYWGIDKDRSINPDAVTVTDNNRYGTVVAEKAGTAIIYSELFGSYPQINYHERYNSAKKKWETYTTTTYRSKGFWRYATVTVLDDNPPTIEAMAETAIAAKGKKVSVTAKATTGSGTSLKYQWYYANPGSSKFSKASITSATYSVEMTDARNGRRVYCVVTDGNGRSTKSATVTLKMAKVPKITTQPKTVTADAGKTAKTTVKATGEGKLTYTWYVKSPGKDSYSKSSVTSASYSTTMTPEINGRKVYCVVSDQYGQSVKSETVTLKMSSNLAIYSQPSNATAISGQKASVTVKATGSGKLKYTWYVQSPGKSTFSKSSITSATYSVTMNADNNGRKLYCVVSNSSGKKVTSNTVKLSTIGKLKITTQPTSIKVAEGKSAKFSVKVSGGSGVKYQWYYANAGSSKFSKSSATSANYSTKMQDGRDGRQFYCVITDKYGQKVQTKTVTMTKAKPITITQQPVSVTVKNGKKATATVAATGEGTLKYQWYIKNADSSKFSKSSITSATYATTMKKAMDGRQIYCVITDSYGQKVTTETVTLNMVHPIKVVMQPEDGGYYDEYEFRVTGTGPMKFEWYVRAPRNDEFVLFKTDEDRSAGLYEYAWSYIDFGFDQGRALRGGELYCLVTDNYGQSVKSRVAQIAK